jgi:hypothetical protein
MIRVATSGTGTIATNGIVSIRHAGVAVSTSNAGVLDVQASAATGAMTVVNIMATAASQTATNLLNVTQSGATLTAYTGSIASFTGGFSGGSSTGNVIGVTAVNTTAGDGVLLTNNALTVGSATLLHLVHTTSVLGAGTSMLSISSSSADTNTTTGTLVNLAQTGVAVATNMMMLTDSSTDTSARADISVKITSAAATLAVPVKLSNVALVSSYFVKLMTFTNGTQTCSMWMSDGTHTPNAALTGSTGDICLNGASGNSYICTATTTWAALS